MKNKFLLFLGLLISGSAICATENESEMSMSEKLVANYKIYSVAQCITHNYTRMGVDFSKLKLKDYTMGFIDLEDGLAFNAKPDNALNAFINSKTGHFYQPKQPEGDLAAANLVIYQCVEFSQSKELDIFLTDLILKKTQIMETTANP